MAGKTTKSTKDQKDRVLATNRNARRDYEVLETLEAGVVLRGSEVKSLREGHVQFADANVWIDRGEAWVLGVHVQPWLTSGTTWTHDPDRRRKLLLHRHEIDRLAARQASDRVAIVPLSIYLKEGRVKVELAVGRGRRQEDKRQVLAKRDAELDMQRALARQRSGKAVYDR
jgi:SsrA-binding protein